MVDLKIFTDNIEQEAINQINNITEQSAFADSKIRIMPDTHAGKGCVIGFTGTYIDKIIPNIVGVDLSCGMLVYELGNINIDLQLLDEVINENFNLGLGEARKNALTNFDFSKLKMYHSLVKEDYLLRSIGTIGSGNHFVELDINKKGEKFLIVHSGSRNLGVQVANYYQQLAVIHCSLQQKSLQKESQQLIKEYKKQGRQKEIQSALRQLKEQYNHIEAYYNQDLAYIEGEDMQDYLHDIEVCKEYAHLNRVAILEIILREYGSRVGKVLVPQNTFETLHNYVDIKHKIIRKGAIAAYQDQRVLIPLNMRDGCIIGIGKGNEDWNYSAPHGAGRQMSRSKACELLSMEEYQNSMKQVYTTSVVESTIDEAPMAYKPSEEIVQLIQPTIEIEQNIKPIYNFKNKE